MHYELYGYGGVGIIAEIMTDNKNRIAAEVRIATNKCGGTIAHPGSVVFNFDHKGIIRVSKHQAIEDELFLAVTDAGAEDFVVEDEEFVVICDPTSYDKIKEAIHNLGVERMDAHLEMIPKTYVECNVETAKLNIALIEWLDGIDDVDTVFHNMKLPEELAKAEDE